MSIEIEKSKPNGYSNEVFCWLLDMKKGTVIVIDNFVEAKTKNYFIDVVKWYIKVYGDVEFNSEYTNLKKI